MNYITSSANMLIVKESDLHLSINLTSVELNSQSKSKEFSKTSVSETPVVLQSKSIISDTDKSVKRRFKKKRVSEQKRNRIYTP